MELAGLVTRMLSPNPIARPGSVQAVAEELNRIKQRIDIQHNVSHIWKPPTPQGYPRISLPPVPPAPPKRFTRRKALAIAGIGTLATGMICAGTSFLLGKLWDGLSTASDDIYAGHSGPVYNIAWHAHDMYMASASADRTVQVIDLGGDPDAHGNNLSSSYACTRHKGAVNGVSWSPDGKYFVSASADGTVQSRLVGW